MKIKTAELEGKALNWAIAKCQGDKRLITTEVRFGLTVPVSKVPPYLTSPALVEDIVEAYRIDTLCDAEGWYANMYWRGMDNTPGVGDSFRCGGDGPTRLVAAMRCYVTSVLGDEVDIPEDLK